MKNPITYLKEKIESYKPYRQAWKDVTSAYTTEVKGTSKNIWLAFKDQGPYSLKRK